MRVAFTANGKCQILGEIFSKEKRREDKNSFNHSFFFFSALLGFINIQNYIKHFYKGREKRHLYPKGQGRTGPKDPSEVPPEKVKRAKKDFKKP